jgi:hypothetical protein
MPRIGLPRGGLVNIPLSDVIPSVMALICLTGIGLSAYLLLRRELPPRVDNHHDVVAKEYAAAFVGLALALADHEKMATLVCDSVSAGVAIALLIVTWRGLMAYFAAQAVKRRLAAPVGDDKRPTN